MSDMLERAAKALSKCEQDNSSDIFKAGDLPWEKYAGGYKDRLRYNARAALLAALDPEDEALRILFADILYACACNKEGARDAITALREACIQKAER